MIYWLYIYLGSDQREYLRSVGRREIEWTRKFGKPQVNDFPHNTVLKGEVFSKIYLDLLDKYLSVASYLLPRDRKNPLNRPTLRHPGNYSQSYRWILL